MKALGSKAELDRHGSGAEIRRALFDDYYVVSRSGVFQLFNSSSLASMSK